MDNNFERSRTPITPIGGHSVHPNKNNLSFGNWAIPVMARKMQDPNPIEKRRAMQAFCDIAFDPKRVASKEFATTSAGRKVFGESDFYDHVLKLISDDDKSVRHAANIVLQRLALSPMAAEELVAATAIPRLIPQMTIEDDDTLEILLQNIYSCCRVDPDQVLNCNGLEHTIPLLKSINPRVKEAAATIIKELSISIKGRNKVLELSALPILLDMLDDDDEMVLAKVLSALMMIVVNTPAKFICLQGNVIDKLLPFLKNKNTEIRLYSLKILTALSETPTGRKILLDNMLTVTRCLNDKDQNVKKAVKKLVTFITR